MNPLTNVRRAAAKVAQAGEGLDAAVRAAHAAGLPLRAIAEAAGVSHEQIRRIAQTK